MGRDLEVSLFLSNGLESQLVQQRSLAEPERENTQTRATGQQ